MNDLSAPVLQNSGSSDDSAPLSSDKSSDASFVIGGAIAGTVFMIIMIICACTERQWGMFLQMWFIGTIFSSVTGIFCIQDYSPRQSAVAAVTSLIPFLLCSLVAFGYSFIF